MRHRLPSSLTNGLSPKVQSLKDTGSFMPRPMLLRPLLGRATSHNRK
jgi:hypothetical protein